MLIRLERAVERMVEGGIAGAFRLRVQPAEIGRHLERAMRDGRKRSVGGTLAPNHFTVRLHPEDAAAFAGWEAALGLELERWLAELAFAQGFATVGPIQVLLATDAAVRRRAVSVEAQYAERSLHETAGAPHSLRLLPRTQHYPPATLHHAAVTVGRGSDNDLVLDHPQVSRHHARLEPAEPGWVVIDLGSTNGTWRNGTAVADAPLELHDEIAFGGVRYVVVSR